MGNSPPLARNGDDASLGCNSRVEAWSTVRVRGSAPPERLGEAAAGSGWHSEEAEAVLLGAAGGGISGRITAAGS